MPEEGGRMLQTSERVLRALLEDLPTREGSEWLLSVTAAGNVVITFSYPEWTGMGCEWEYEEAFRGSPDAAFRWLCERLQRVV